MSRRNVKPMSIERFTLLLGDIFDKHSVNCMLTGRSMVENAKKIKYVRPQIDMRDGKVFTVTFEGFNFSSRMFTIVNREEADLEKEIRDWLEEEVEK